MWLIVFDDGAGAQPWHSRPAGHSHGTAVQPGTAVAQPSSRAQPWHSPPAGHSHGTAVQPGTAVARCMIVGGAHFFPGKGMCQGVQYGSNIAQLYPKGVPVKNICDLYFIDLYL